MSSRSTSGLRMQLRQPRLAEIVADALRQRIVSGDLTDGGLLPKQEETIEKFKVSKPSLLEALRILETEGAPRRLDLLCVERRRHADRRRAVALITARR